MQCPQGMGSAPMLPDRLSGWIPRILIAVLSFLFAPGNRDRERENERERERKRGEWRESCTSTALRTNAQIPTSRDPWLLVPEHLAGMSQRVKEALETQRKRSC